MVVDEKLLNKLENLSMLRVKEELRETREKEIGDILEFVGVLNSLDVLGVEATFSTVEGGTLLRDDSPVANDSIDTVLKNAPKKEDGFFIVPKIIE